MNDSVVSWLPNIAGNSSHREDQHHRNHANEYVSNDQPVAQTPQQLAPHQRKRRKIAAQMKTNSKNAAHPEKIPAHFNRPVSEAPALRTRCTVPPPMRQSAPDRSADRIRRAQTPLEVEQRGFHPAWDHIRPKAARCTRKALYGAPKSNMPERNAQNISVTERVTDHNLLKVSQGSARM